MMKVLWIASLMLAATAGQVQASVITIDFEGVAPIGGLVNVNPGAPYFEDGFTITPTDSQSAVFDAAAANSMIGNVSDWFGFAASNTPTLTLTAPTGPFSLIDVLIGPSTIGASSIDMTIIGHIFGGGTVSSTFTSLTTATVATLNFSNLASVDFIASSDAGLDNIRLDTAAVPEPSSIAMFGVGALGLVFASRKRQQKKLTA